MSLRENTWICDSCRYQHPSEDKPDMPCPECGATAWEQRFPGEY